eukprot:gene6273-6994_t
MSVTTTTMPRTALLLQLTYLYFLQGIPYGFQVKYLPLVLRKHGHDLDVISFLSFVSLPWILKFLWAPLFDHYGGNGRIWIGGCLLLLSMFSALLHSATGSLYIMVPCLLVLSFLSASLDIAVDSLAIKLFAPKDLGYCNIGHVVGYKVGILSGGGLLLTFHRDIGLRNFTWGLSAIFGASALIFVLFNFAIFTKQEFKKNIKQKKANNDYPAKAGNRSLLVQVLLSPDQIWLVVFVFIYKLGEQGFISMYPMLLVDQDLPLHHIGMITGIFGHICSMAGSTVGGLLVSKYRLNIRELLFRTASLRFLLIVSYSTLLTRYSISILPHIIIDSAFQLLAGAMTTLTFTAMMQASKVLPSQIHAAHFTFLAAFEVLGKLTMKSLSGTITTAVDGLVVIWAFVKCKFEYFQPEIELKTE